MAAHRQGHNPPSVLRAHRPKPADVESLGIPYGDVQPPQVIVTEDIPPRHGWVKHHLHHIGFGMLLMLALWYIGTNYALPFAAQTIAHWNCGADRICQYDFDVGHHGTSHFITEYWHSQVIVIEVPQSRPEHTKLYAQTIIAKPQDTSPRIVTLTTAYVSHHPKLGNPDLVATVSGFAFPVIFYNTGDGFSTEEPSE